MNSKHRRLIAIYSYSCCSFLVRFLLVVLVFVVFVVFVVVVETLVYFWAQSVSTEQVCVLSVLVRR